MSVECDPKVLANAMRTMASMHPRFFWSDTMIQGADLIDRLLAAQRPGDAPTPDDLAAMME